MPTTKNLSMIRGSTPTWRMTLLDGAVACDLTGATVRMTAKKVVTDADPGVFQKAIGSGITVVGAATAGVIDVKLSASDTTSLTQDTTLQYDVKVTHPDGTIGYPIIGRLQVAYNVTVAS